jgi:hypothetical protein
MSNLKYKVGDRFKDNHNDSLEIEILQCVENDMNPYRVKYSNQFDEDYVCDIIIDKYYTKIEETKQIGGNHYSKLAIEPYEYSVKNELNCYQFNVVKYVTRYKDKNGVEDLKKAIQTLQKLIEYEEGNN